MVRVPFSSAQSPLAVVRYDRIRYANRNVTSDTFGYEFGIGHCVINILIINDFICLKMCSCLSKCYILDELYTFKSCLYVIIVMMYFGHVENSV